MSEGDHERLRTVLPQRTRMPSETNETRAYKREKRSKKDISIMKSTWY
jgi:hypothetical protein